MECLEGIVGADAVTGCVLADLGGDCGFVGVISAGFVGGFDEFIVFFSGDNVEFAHELCDGLIGGRDCPLCK